MFVNSGWAHKNSFFDFPCRLDKMGRFSGLTKLTWKVCFNLIWLIMFCVKSFLWIDFNDKTWLWSYIFAASVFLDNKQLLAAEQEFELGAFFVSNTSKCGLLSVPEVKNFSKSPTAFDQTQARKNQNVFWRDVINNSLMPHASNNNNTVTVRDMNTTFVPSLITRKKLLVV